jgi:hypothetical protein
MNDENASASQSAKAIDPPAAAASPSPPGARRRRWLLGSVATSMALGAGLFGWATRDQRSVAATDRAVAQIRDRLSSRLAAMDAVPLSVSPDRRLAVVGRRRDDGYQLELLRVSDRKVLRTALLETPSELVWRPQSDVLALSAPSGSTAALYLWGASEESPRVVETWLSPEPAAHLAWDAAGSRLAFVRPEGGPSQLRLARAMDLSGGARTLASTDDIRGLAWVAGSAQAGLAIVAPTICRGIAVVAVSARAANSESVRTAAASAPMQCLALRAGQEPRHVAHDPRSNRFLISARPQGGQFFQLLELDAGAGTEEVLAAPDGDVASPSYTATGYLYQVERSGHATVLVGPGRVVPAPLGGGRSRLLSLSADGSTALFWHAGTTRPPEVIEVPLVGGAAPRTLFAAALRDPFTGIEPELVTIGDAKEGVELRDFLWRSPRSAQPRKLVIEVAAQGEQPDPTFRLPRDQLLQEGFDVLLAVHRGVTGFGAKFAEPVEPTAQAGDLSLSLRHTVEGLGYRAENIVVLAAGRAATLVAMAANTVPNHLRHMLLIDPAATTCESQHPKVAGRRLTLFHAKGGPRTLGETELLAASWLGQSAVEPPFGRVKQLDLASMRRGAPVALSAITEELARLLLVPPT